MAEAVLVRTLPEVLADIGSVGRQAWEDGDLKTALRALEMEAKYVGALEEKEAGSLAGSLGAAGRTPALVLSWQS